MTERTARAATVPAVVPILNPIARRLLAAGMPMGFNGLVTIRGRTTGEPRTTPLAIIDREGRRWIWSPWGDVHWVRNLRAAGEATISVRRHEEQVTATELDADQRVAFFRDVMGPIARGIPFGYTFVRLFDGTNLNDPVGAAEGRAVFELHARE